MVTASLTSKGQITIPKSIRESLRVSTGDKISFVLSEDGEVILRPLSKKATEVFGLLARSDKKAVSIDEMNEQVEQALRDGKI